MKSSGKGQVFSRERAASEQKLEYVAIWLQTAAHQGAPMGVLHAYAASLSRHWGICRNARSYGLRVCCEDAARARGMLRPQDKSIIEINRSLIPTKVGSSRGS